MAKSRVVQVVINDNMDEQLKKFKENFSQYADYVITDADWLKNAVRILNKCVEQGLIEKRDNFY